MRTAWSLLALYTVKFFPSSIRRLFWKKRQNSSSVLQSRADGRSDGRRSSGRFSPNCTEKEPNVVRCCSVTSEGSAAGRRHDVSLWHRNGLKRIHPCFHRCCDQFIVLSTKCQKIVKNGRKAKGGVFSFLLSVQQSKDIQFIIMWQRTEANPHIWEAEGG